MNAILHGTWVTSADGREDELFFVWAERTAPAPKPRRITSRIQRHPYGATTIEIADLLSAYVPHRDWRAAERMTRIALLPSIKHAPVVPRWLIDDGEESGQEPNGLASPSLQPWRIEGIGVPLLHMVDVLAALPSIDHNLTTSHQVGNDLRYWGIVTKFVLELLARQRFIPGLRFRDHAVHSVWLPLLDDPEDQQRLELLAQGMPPACRAIFYESSEILPEDAASSRQSLQSFVEHLMDHAVRDWTRASPHADELGSRPSRRMTVSSSAPIGAIWWNSLWSEHSKIDVPASKEDEVTRFYQAWQGWTYRAQPTADVSFRLCFRLDPPEFDSEHGRVISPQWALRYFLQAKDDLSLLVPAREVWRERGEVLNYLNRRFDHPQETLLAGLGMAARLSPAIQRSLRSECPEDTTLSSQEAYTFLRETARLLEGMGFGVLVPPWWNKPDTRLRVRATLHMSQETASGILNMDSLVTYDWELALGDETLTHDEFERLAALKTPLVRVRGRWVLLQPDQVEAAIAFWQKQQEREGKQLALREALSLALGVQQEIDGLNVSEVDTDDQFSELIDALTQGDQIEHLEPPKGFVGKLRPYQIRGLSWLAFLRRWGFGACLADDMGLGKTIQAIALILHEREHNNVQAPSLVICPTSVVGNWQREVAKFAPELKLMVHHGSGRAEGRDFLEQSQAHDLVISTYGLVRRDIEDLSQVHWGNIILDEAQNIKNSLTKQARAVRNLQGDYRVALTGTPVENHLSELWSIMSFLNPSYLGSRESFQRNWAIPIERYQDPEASEQLRKLVRPFILRRVKTDPQVIQDLPEKFEQKVYCNLTREQATLYEAVIRDAMAELRETDDNTGIKRRGMILAMLTRLKQVCNHPVLFLGDRSATAGRSGKLNRLVEMLEEVLAVGDRALIFTQFAQMGHLLQRHLQSTFGQEVLFLHGGTSQKQRDRMLVRFQDDEDGPAIFILSLKAGGTGLNLMRANHVFHYDRWWNPAVENQATDRAYRIGQTRDVQVHKYICLGTLEERIDMLIESKSALAESVVGSGEDWLTELSTDELYDLMALRTEAVEVD